MNRAILSIIFFLSFVNSGLLAQYHITFSHLTTENGLSHSSVTCILQDSKGFMWFGTQDGLNKYDGYTFKIFKNDPADPASLANNFIFSIYENPAGDLYIETQGQILHRYNPVRNRIIRSRGSQIVCVYLTNNNFFVAIYEPLLNR